MRAPAFWWEPKPSLLAQLLKPIGAFYGEIAAQRMRLRGDTVGVPVICVGNFTLGGAGKTPTALALGRLLAAQGQTPFCLTRGYGGRLGGPVRVDVSVHDARDVGDESLLLARVCPTIVARNRLAGALLAANSGASVIIMDDGLQNPSVEKDLALAVFDATTGTGNGFCFPAGPLRAPAAAQWPKVDAVIIIGEGKPGAGIAKEATELGKSVFQARLEADRTTSGRLEGRQVFAFAGIGRPAKFFATLAESGAAVVRSRSFPDHHPYRSDEIRAIVAEADAAQLEIITTEKDFVRLASLTELGPTLDRVQAFPVQLILDDEQALRDLALSHVAGHRSH